MKAPTPLAIAVVVTVSVLGSFPDLVRAANIQQPPAQDLTRQPQAAPAPVGKKEPLRKTLPDLVVDLKTTTGKYDYPGKGTCDTINADFTVTNTGQREAKNFFVTVETKNEFHDWNVFWKLSVPSLAGGAHIAENAGITERWCPGNTRTGFRVTADPDFTVHESNENNNAKTVLFPTIPRDMIRENIQLK
ncbi:MAG: CARDB domain-containing protein [Candidatus Geothermincolia bacterium]